MKGSHLRTFVFGAGASVHAGYPLAFDLGDELRAWLHQQTHLVLQDWRAAVDQAYSLYGDLKNIEEVLTDLDTPAVGSPSVNIEPSVRQYISNSFLGSIREFFRSIASGKATLYEDFARNCVRPGDVIITFNYDVELERELKRAGMWELKDGYGFSIEVPGVPPSKVLVLKLHGSVNWLGLIFGGFSGGGQLSASRGQVSGPRGSLGLRPAIFGSDDFKYLGYSKDSRDPEAGPATRSGAIPAMIMPIRKKRFYMDSSLGREWEDFWNNLWMQAGDAIRSSEQLFVIGYSMPPADELARNLLLQDTSRNARVSLCCGGRTLQLRDEFAKSGFKHIETFKGGRFENFLADRCSPVSTLSTT